MEGHDVIHVSQPVLGEVEMRAVEDVISSGWITMGARVEEFETEFARRLGSRHAVMTTSGTTALHLTLASLGIGPGAEVIVPDLTYAATAAAVKHCGATPVLVDVGRDSWGMRAADVERAVTRHTRAILAVHLYGAACDVRGLLELSSRTGIPLVEDACEALGAKPAAGRRLGTIGTAGCFSFYGNKVMTTGEGGMVVTDDEGLARRMRHLRGQAMDPQRRYWHDDVGYNYRPTELAAAIGLCQLARLDELVERRRVVVDRYVANLGDVVKGSPSLDPAAAPWLVTVLLPSGTRDAVARMLEDYGVETRPTFVPLHRMPPYRWFSGGEFPVASHVGDCGLSLPTYADLSPRDVDRVCQALESALRRAEVAA